MDREHIKGAADKAKGAVKEAAGNMMNDKKLEAEGKFDKAKGAPALRYALIWRKLNDIKGLGKSLTY